MKFVIFGAGNIGEQVLIEYWKSLQIKGFYDNSEIGDVYGWKIKKPVYEKDIFIIVASNQYYDIRIQLIELGYAEFKNFVPYQIFRKKIAIAYGNCHMQAVKTYLERNADFTKDYGFYPFPMIQHMHMLEQYTSVLRYCELFIHQSIRKENKFGENYSSENIIRYLPDGCPVISIPNLHGMPICFFPQQKINDTLQGRNMQYYFDSGKDVNIERWIYEGKTKEEIKSFIINGGVYGRKEITNMWEQFETKLYEREKEWNIKIGDYIKKNYKRKKLFYERVHISNDLVKEIASRLLNYLGYDGKLLCEVPIWLNGREMFIYQDVVEALGLEFEQKYIRITPKDGLLNKRDMDIDEYLCQAYKWVSRPTSAKQERMELEKFGETIKVSVLIPVYNCETYLEQCLKSVISQTLRELEIICVNDGSTDNSGKILKRYQEIDHRIKVLQQENQGAGVARNLALKRAKGRYISFLDADDYLKEENALEIMVDMCKSRKISVCASRKRCLANEEEEINELFGEECVGKVLKYKEYQMDFFYQNYLFERRLLEEHQIYFPPYRRYQDPPFFVRTLWTAKEFTVADTCLYCYRTSMDFNEKFDVQKTEDMLKGMVDNLVFAEKNELDILFCNTADLLENNKAIVKVIYENITPDGLGVLELLLKLNQIISNKYKKYHYVIKPLRLLLFNIKLYKKYLLQTIRLQNEIAIYGAGVYAKGFLNFLNRNEMLFMVKNIVVTKMDYNPSHIGGIPVMTLSEFLDMNKKAFLIIAVNDKDSKEIVKYVEEKKCRDYLMIDEIFWEQEIFL